MRVSSEPARPKRLGWILLLSCAPAITPGHAQTRLTLQQAQSRTAPDYVPTYEGKDVVVAGQVSAKPILVTDSYYLPIQDEAQYGLLLQGPESRFRGLEPGDWIEAEGTILRRGGRPAFVPQDIRRQGHTDPPARSLAAG